MVNVSKIALVLVLSASIRRESALGQIVKLDESDKIANVELLLVDSFMTRLSAPTVRVEHLSDGAISESFVAQSRNIRLKYGDYRFRLEQSGYSSSVRIVSINSSPVTVRLCVFPSPIEHTQELSLVRGRIEVRAHGHNCRMVQVFCLCDGSSREINISPGGQFIATGLRPGIYIGVGVGESTGELRACGLSEFSVKMRSEQDVKVVLR